MSAIRVEAVRFEHHREALGIGESAPRLSWRTESPEDWEQIAYELQIGDEVVHVDSAESVLVPWPSTPLLSRERREVRVRVFGRDGEASEWSPPAAVEAGLQLSDWQAALIEPAVDERGPAALFRQEFSLDGDAVSARLYATAHGLYIAEINGQRVGDEAFAPGWTSYHHRLRYQTYNVTHLLRPGPNAIGAQVADGWWRGRLTFVPGKRDTYGTRLGLLAQLEITYADGRRLVVGTDEAWRSSSGPIRFADLYDGEHYDARLEVPGWSEPAFDDAGWARCHRREFDFATLVAPDGPPIRAVEVLSVRQTLTTPSGRAVFDFGQNLVGRLRIRAQGTRDATVTLRHAEVLEDGEQAVGPLRSAEATDRYTIRGEATAEEWEPQFTFHGFRYAEIAGDHDACEASAVVYHSDMERTGWFECSNELLTKLHENVVWSMRGNFLDVPTDCPQRDERLGWCGDLQVFAPTAAYLYDCAGLLTSWLRDLAADQTPEGVVPIFVPRIDFGGSSVLLAQPVPQAGWGDAAVLVPWLLYERFGDVEVLRRQYPSMCAWVDGLTASLGPGTLFDKPAFQLGDWLDPAAPPEAAWDGATDSHLVATAYRAHVAEVLSRTAAVIGEDADARRYAWVADGVRQAFKAEYVTANGRMASDSQTAYALGLEFDLLRDSAQRDRAGSRLVELVRRTDHRIATGFLGTPLICDALTNVGAIDDAYALVLQTEPPSWLYALTMGATTTWERWDSMLPDGSLNSSAMTSFNHYALGAVADWLHRVVGGLAPAEPGYRSLLVRPIPGGGLTSARTAHLTPYGRAEVSWRRERTRLAIEAVVPTGTTATLHLPSGQTVGVGPGRHELECAYRDPADDPA